MLITVKAITPHKAVLRVNAVKGGGNHHSNGGHPCHGTAVIADNPHVYHAPPLPAPVVIVKRPPATIHVNMH